MITAKRILHTLVFTALVFGLMFSLTTDVSAKKSKQTASNASCAFWESNYWGYLDKWSDAYHNGNTEDANFYQAMAQQQIAAARAGGCAWPGVVHPDSVAV